MIDLEHETPLVLGDVPTFLSGLGFPKPHKAVPRRWGTRGVRGRILETIRLGNILYTTKEAVLRFLQADAPPQRPQGVQARRVARQQQVQAAERRAEAMGI